jgi:hypothetical protein
MDNLEINPDEFARDGGDFTQVGDEAESIGSGLVNGVRLQGAFYGGDKFGKAFAASFNPGVELLGDAIRTTKTSMGNTGVSLTASGKAYVQTNQHNEESIPNLP